MRFDTLVLGTNIRCNSRPGRMQGGLAIAHGRVVALLDEETACASRSAAATVIDAGERLVLPGLIDGHVHLRDPGQIHKEDFASGARAAAAGGVSTIIAQPNTTPEIGDKEMFAEVRRIGEARSIVDFGIAARLDPRRPEEAVALAAPLSLSVGCYCEDAALAAHAAHRAMDAGLSGADRFFAGLPDETETAAAAQLWYLAHHLRVRVLYRQVSAASTLAFLTQARRRGGVACAVEVNPHHLRLTIDDMRRIGTGAKIKPPLRSSADNAALWHGLAEGNVDLVGTDHAPHARAEKDTPFDRAPPGFPGLETLLPVLMNGVAEGRMSIERLIAVACEFPARWYGMADRKGSLRPGGDADLVIVDQQVKRALDPSVLQTKAAQSPFAGIPLTGWPVATMVRGALVWEEGRAPNAEPDGRFVPARFRT